MALTLHHGNRLEALADRLAAQLATPAGGVLEPEIVLVQHAGMARWLSLQLARRNQVCSAVRFRPPAAFAWEVLRAVVPDLPAASRWEVQVVGWRLMAELAACAGDARFAPVAAYLARAADGAEADLRRHQLATRLAALFDQYGTYRPQMLGAWEAGAEPDDWQAELWRRLVAAVGQPHRAGLQRRVVQALAAGPPAAVAARVSVFGIPGLPPQELDLLAALAVHRDVHLFLLNPCREYAGDVRSARAVARLARDRDPAALLLEVGNPLLASMGRQPIELLERVLERDGLIDDDCFAEPAGAHLLAAVQSDILHLRNRGPDPGDAERLPLAPDDRSIQLHVCHSPMREVEVLYDQLLALFAERPDLQPADVVVMTPAVEQYAPCFDAVRAAAPEGRRIPFTVADVGLRAERPLIEAFLGVLQLPDGRFEVDRLLALLGAPPVRRRFGLDEGDLEQIAAWVRDAGIRWGQDADARVRAGLPRTAEHTWRFGLDRLLLGYALPGRGHELFGDVLPFDDVEGSQARTLGALAAFAAAADAATRALAAPRPVGVWAADLRALLDRFCDPGDDEEDAARAVREALAELADAAARAAFDAPVSRAVVAAWLADALATRMPGGRFLAGAVTVCQLVPMRSVPFEVVCLLGMDVAGFPRADRAPGFDRIARKRERGDRSRRDDDRTLFLEALLSARSRLHVSWVGRSIRDNAEIPPSVLVSELLDYVDRGWIPPPGRRRARDHLTVEHRLQAFSRRYFDGSDPRLFSHADDLCAAVAEAARAGGRAATPLVVGRLPPLRETSPVVHLDALVAFFTGPARALLQDRLGIRIAGAHELPEPREPFALDGLERHGLDVELLALRRARRPLDEAAAVLRARGALPHGALGESVVRERIGSADALATRLAAALPSPDPEPIALDVALAGVRLVGALDGVGPAGRVAWRVGRLRVVDRLAAWIRHLALQMAPVEEPQRTSLWIGSDAAFQLRPVHAAADALAVLVDVFFQGRERLVPLLPRASWAFAEAVQEGRSGEAAARAEWFPRQHGQITVPGEGDEPWNRLAWRGVLPFAQPDFARLAHAVLDPLRAHTDGVPA